MRRWSFLKGINKRAFILRNHILVGAFVSSSFWACLLYGLEYPRILRNVFLKATEEIKVVAIYGYSPFVLQIFSRFYKYSYYNSLEFNSMRKKPFAIDYVVWIMLFEILNLFANKRITIIKDLSQLCSNSSSSLDISLELSSVSSLTYPHYWPSLDLSKPFKTMTLKCSKNTHFWVHLSYFYHIHLNILICTTLVLCFLIDQYSAPSVLVGLIAVF